MVGPASGYSASRARSFLQIEPTNRNLDDLNRLRSEMAYKGPRRKDAESWMQRRKWLAPFYLKGGKPPQYKMQLFGTGITIRPVEYDYAVLPIRGAMNKSLLYFFKAKEGGEYNIGDWEFTVVFREGCRPYKVYSPFEEWQVDVLAFMNGISSNLPESISIGLEHIKTVQGKGEKPCLNLIDNVQSRYSPFGEENGHVTTPVKGKGSPIMLPIEGQSVPLRRIRSREIEKLDSSIFQTRALLTGLELSAQHDRSNVIVDINGKLRDGRSFLLEIVTPDDRGGWKIVNYEGWVGGELDSPPGFFQLAALRRTGRYRSSLQFEGLGSFTNVLVRNRPYLRSARDGKIYVILGLNQDQEMAFWGWNEQGEPHFLQEAQLRRRGCGRVKST